MHIDLLLHLAVGQLVETLWFDIILAHSSLDLYPPL